MANSEHERTGLLAAYDLFDGSPYRTLRRLQAGAMGEVFLVAHRESERELVAKLLHDRLSTDPRLLERMRIEAQALAQLEHPHVVSIVGFEQTHSGRPFIVMESLQGRSLAEELRERGKLPVVEALTYACEALSALAAAHRIGLVHRDVKPDNLFVCRRADGTGYIKLLDFGVARILPGASSIAPLPRNLRTEAGVVLGTPRFASPEAATGQHVDERADLYALGLVLYVMLAGRGPFDHLEGDGTLLEAQAREAAAPPSCFAREPVPRELDAALLKALAKVPSERFQTADEFRHHLELVLELLRRPSGWLYTTAFDASLLASAASNEQAPPKGASAAPAKVAIPAPPRSVKGRFSASVVVTAFMLAMLLSGVASMTVLSLLGSR